MPGTLGSEYELERQTEVGDYLDLLTFGGYPSHIGSHERMETGVGSEARAHTDLSPIVDNPSPSGCKGSGRT